MDGSSEAPRPRGTGRPSTVKQYAPQIAEWLQRLRLAGYRGGKSSLYELVRRLRVSARG
jgi:hypothetical protein